MAIFVIGGANLDIYAKVNNNDVVLYDSNPSDISFSFGGVGRNILDNIANLDANPYFVSVFSLDPYGKEMYDDFGRLFEVSEEVTQKYKSREAAPSFVIKLLAKIFSPII